MNRDFIRRFVHNLFFGTRDRALVSYIGGAVLACLIIYGLPIYVMVAYFGMTLVAAMGVMSDVWLAAIIIYIIYRLSRAVVSAWRETKDN